MYHRQILPFFAILLCLMCASCGGSRLKITADEFKKQYAETVITAKSSVDYLTAYNKTLQMMKTRYSSQITVVSPGIGVNGYEFEADKTAQIEMGMYRPIGMQKDIVVDFFEVDGGTEAKLYSWNKNIVDADKVAEIIKEFIEGL